MNRGKNKQSSKEISKVADKMRVILVDELDALVTKK